MGGRLFERVAFDEERKFAPVRFAFGCHVNCAADFGHLGGFRVLLRCKSSDRFGSFCFHSGVTAGGTGGLGGSRGGLPKIGGCGRVYGSPLIIRIRSSTVARSGK